MPLVHEETCTEDRGTLRAPQDLLQASPSLTGGPSSLMHLLPVAFGVLVGVETRPEILR